MGVLAGVLTLLLVAAGSLGCLSGTCWLWAHLWRALGPLALARRHAHPHTGLPLVPLLAAFQGAHALPTLHTPLCSPVLQRMTTSTHAMVVGTTHRYRSKYVTTVM